MKRRTALGILALAAIAGSVAALQGGISLLGSTPDAPPIDTFTVAERRLAFHAEATGLLRALAVQNFGAPPQVGNYWNFQLASMAPEGQNVKKGDVLATFDQPRVREDLERFKNELEQAAKELEKTRVRIDLERQDILWRVAAAENKAEKFKLRQGISSAIEASTNIELDALRLEQAQRELKALQERLEWHKKSSEAAYRVIASKKTRAENKVQELERGIAGFQARADRDGVVVYKIKWNGEKFRVGEQTWSGQPVMEIPDLNTIIAEAFVPEVDLGKVKIGQRVEITIDAFPGKTYTGRITNLGTLVRTKAWDIPNKVLDAQITLDHLDTSVMRPAMSLRAKIEVSSIERCLAIPLRSVRSSAGGASVKVRSGSAWEERQVKLGAANGSDVVVREGLRAGDRIALDFARAK